jgi:crotonobetainyl-CoA:carnitine CoA-transferase CaiB-like acyl-CoA transferase
MVHEIDHPRIGPMKTIGLPLKTTGELGEIRLPAPWLGQHSREVLQSLGYADPDIDRLFDAGVVMDRYRHEN